MKFSELIIYFVIGFGYILCAYLGFLLGKFLEWRRISRLPENRQR